MSAPREIHISTMNILLMVWMIRTIRKLACIKYATLDVVRYFFVRFEPRRRELIRQRETAASYVAPSAL